MSFFPHFHPRLQDAIASRLGWTSLRPVQDLAGEALLAGHNAVILAPTAGGKTEAALFPTLSLLLEHPPQAVGALYIAPIKALLNNQAERLGLYTEMVGLRRFVWHGDTSDHERRRFLREPTELLMTTPESLEVMLISQRVDATALFTDLRIVIVDEVHAVAGSDRGAHLMSVLERLARLSRHDLQRVGLSATVGNPAAILRWLQGSSSRPGQVVDPPKVPGRRQLLVTHRPDLGELARDAAHLARGQKSLFFCQSRAVTEAVAEHMRRAGTEVFVHHSAVSREERETAEERFHHGADACIVCTSTLELGIDVGDLDRVFQAEAPDTVGSFLQRMGRTGRRTGQAANTTFLCESAESVLQAIALIELAKQGWVEDVPVRTRTWPVLLHQLLALALAEDGVTLEAAWSHLSRVPDFQGIHRPEFERLVAWMLHDRSLLLLDGRLVLGPTAERRFGRRNFMELYAVFSSPQAYTVLTTAGQPLGTLNQDFVDRLVEGASCFLLSVRAWLVAQLRHGEREVRVEPAPRGRQPTWGGFLPRFLGFELCQRVLQVLCDEAVPPYLHPSATQALAEQRAAFAGVLEPGRGGIEDGTPASGANTGTGTSADTGTGTDEQRWWTFAGGRINATLRQALLALHPDWKVIPDNFLLKVRGEQLRRDELEAAIERLSDPEFWEDEKLWSEVAAGLPNYRLSKFQPLMPPWVEREMLAGFLLDVPGAWRWLSRQWLTGPARPGSGRRQIDATSRDPLTPVSAPSGAQDLRHPSTTPAPPPSANVSPLPFADLQPLPSAALAALPSSELASLPPLDLAALPPTGLKQAGARPSLPVRWIDSAPALRALCDTLVSAPVLGLDVETTLTDHALCLIQIATPEFVALIDALEIEDLSPLSTVLNAAIPLKVIHNASFERSVLGRYGLSIDGVFDTLSVSRAQRGRKLEGGHGLAAVCARELGLEVDKTEQTGDWTRRPLTERQRDYAALDAEVLIRLHQVFSS